MKFENYKIGFYIRVSTQEQAENPEGSIRNQRERLEQMVKMKNFEGNFGEVIHVYIDEAKSGKDTNRAELKRMLRDIESGTINLVMASELSRISRNIQDFAKIWDLMKSLNCKFLSLRENFDTTTAAGEMVMFTLANLSQFERRQVSERVSANFLARAKRGLSNGGPTPPGYKIIEGKPGYLAIDEDEAPTIKKCFEYFLAEETLASAARRLNQENYKLSGKIKGGKATLKHFGVENLYRILTNKALCGVRIYTEFGKEYEVKAVWKGIVPKRTFNKVQKILKANCSVKKKDNPRRFPYILTGLVFCAECGDRLCGKSAHGAKRKVGYYEHGWRYRRNYCKTEAMHNCSNPTRFNAEMVHELVIEKVSELLNDEKIAMRLLKRAHELDKKDPIKADIRRFQNRRSNIDRKLEVITERITELPKEISAKGLYTKMGELQKQRDEVCRLIDEKQRELKGLMEKPATEKNWREFLGVFSKVFKTHLSVDEQTRLLKSLIYKIELGSQELKIHYFVGEDHIKKEASIIAGPLFLCPDIRSDSLTYGGRNKD
ncbi:MAG: hypothetical protein CME62_09495 [Halobacteriovoraceae bacterium]|nr:hypothetical protein [Halobacteriovoraceae bacterium]|tara:strand:+ start:288 stop:1928 length:1641 start_codon:yes stop_codon:yes gene_type:complete